MRVEKYNAVQYVTTYTPRKMDVHKKKNQIIRPDEIILPTQYKLWVGKMILSGWII